MNPTNEDIAKLIRALMEAGWIERAPGDNANRRIDFTPKGLSRMTKLEEFSDILKTINRGGHSKKEIEALVRLQPVMRETILEIQIPESFWPTLMSFVQSWTNDTRR